MRFSDYSGWLSELDYDNLVEFKDNQKKSDGLVINIQDV